MIITCTACEARGWLLADSTDYGTRIERCGSCKRFLSDGEACVYVAALASGRGETDAVIETSRFRNQTGLSPCDMPFCDGTAQEDSCYCIDCDSATDEARLALGCWVR